MKKLYTLAISILLIINLASAQASQGFKYQASIRDNNGVALLNKLVAVKISLLAGTANGTSVYTEVHNVVTSDFGIVNLNIGNGTVVSGNFSNIDWGSNTYFIKTEVDINNGTNFLFMGTSQLLSVPYAMFAVKSGNAANDKDQDSLNEIQNINLNGNNLTLNKNGGNVDLTKYDKDSQQLVLNGNTLSITKGNSIVLSGAVDLDADPTNEIQNISISKDTLKLSKANFVVLPKDNDADSTNEIQSLSFSNDILQLSKSNQVTFPKDNDRDSLNEIQQIQQAGNSLTLTKNGGTVIVPSLTNIQNGSILYATASGINNFNLSLPSTPASYSTGMTINFKVPNSNTGHVTVNVNNLGVKPLFKNVSDTMQSDDLLQNKMLSIIYDGQKFQLLNQLNSNYPKSDFAHFVLDTTFGKGWFESNLSSNIWNSCIRFNKDLVKEGNSILRNGDTMYLTKGTYRIKCEVSIYTSNGYHRIRLKNITNNTTDLLGIANNSGQNLSTWMGKNIEMNGYINVLNSSAFLVQYFYSDGSGRIDSPKSTFQSENEIQNSIIIEKIR